jgi:hypothetical protein
MRGDAHVRSDYLNHQMSLFQRHATLVGQCVRQDGGGRVE